MAMTLADVIENGIPEGRGVKIRTATGKWSKVYRSAGLMWRPRGHHTFVVTGPEVWSGNSVTGRRYVDPNTEAVVVRLPEAR